MIHQFLVCHPSLLLQLVATEAAAQMPRADRRTGRDRDCDPCTAEGGPDLYDCKAGTDGKLGLGPFREGRSRRFLLDGQDGRPPLRRAPNWDHARWQRCHRQGARQRARQRSANDIAWLKLEVTGAAAASGVLSSATDHSAQSIPRGGRRVMSGACDKAGAFPQRALRDRLRLFLRKGVVERRGSKDRASVGPMTGGYRRLCASYIPAMNIFALRRSFTCRRVSCMGADPE